MDKRRLENSVRSEATGACPADWRRITAGRPLESAACLMYAQRLGLDELKAEIFVEPARDTHDFVRLKQLDVENAPLLRLITRKERELDAVRDRIDACTPNCARVERDSFIFPIKSSVKCIRSVSDK